MASSSADYDRPSARVSNSKDKDDIEGNMNGLPSLPLASAEHSQPGLEADQPRTLYPKPGLQEQDSRKHPMSQQELHSYLFGYIPSVAGSRPVAERLLRPPQLGPPIVMDQKATLARSRRRHREDADVDSDATPTPANPYPSRRRALSYGPETDDARTPGLGETPDTRSPYHDNDRTPIASVINSRRAAASRVSGAAMDLQQARIDVAAEKGLTEDQVMVRRALLAKYREDSP